MPSPSRALSGFCRSSRPSCATPHDCSRTSPLPDVIDPTTEQRKAVLRRRHQRVDVQKLPMEIQALCTENVAAPSAHFQSSPEDEQRPQSAPSAVHPGEIASVPSSTSPTPSRVCSHVLPSRLSSLPHPSPDPNHPALEVLPSAPSRPHKLAEDAICEGHQADVSFCAIQSDSPRPSGQVLPETGLSLGVHQEWCCHPNGTKETRPVRTTFFPRPCALWPRGLSRRCTSPALRSEVFATLAVAVLRLHRLLC